MGHNILLAAGAACWACICICICNCICICVCIFNLDLRIRLRGSQYVACSRCGSQGLRLQTAGCSCRSQLAPRLQPDSMSPSQPVAKKEKCELLFLEICSGAVQLTPNLLFSIWSVQVREDITRGCTFSFPKGSPAKP